MPTQIGTARSATMRPIRKSVHWSQNVMSMKSEVDVDKAILNHARELYGPQTAAHVSDPGLGLPWGHWFVAPEHKDAIAGMKISRDLRLF